MLAHVLSEGRRHWGSLGHTGKLPLRDRHSCSNRFQFLKR